MSKEQTPQEDEAMDWIFHEEEQDAYAEECDLDLTAVVSGSLISSNIWRDDMSHAIWQEYSKFTEISDLQKSLSNWVTFLSSLVYNTSYSTEHSQEINLIHAQEFNTK